MALLTIEEIMERLCRLSRLDTGIHCRNTFPAGPSKWYVDMRGVSCPVHTIEMSGESPDAAIQATWKVLALPKCPPTLIRYFCAPNESVPGNGPQVWVKWDQEADDWVDVVPPTNHRWQLLASEIRPYSDHRLSEPRI